MNAYSSYLTPEQKKKKLLAQGYSDYLPKAATPQTVNPATSYADYLPAQQPAQNGYANIAKNMQQPAAPAVSGYAAMANNLAATPAPAQNGYGAIAQNMAAATPTSAPASTPTSYYDYARDSAKQSYDSGVAKSWSNLNKNLNPYGAIAESMASRGISQQSGYGAIAQSMASGQYANEQNMARQGY
ncbi:MAG: hypothetical protein EOM59_17220, partial [Clostridia bacterium]|nr:hypothetical protein [Clostridia bacterium]